MQHNKMSLADLKAKANLIDNKSAFEAVRGGAPLNDCHDVYTPTPIDTSVPNSTDNTGHAPILHK